ncbi:unnamed protein product [Caenorhabditis angaria]|uniref:Uncharacterized protein n=1 Tax=Caenorhabditis angaria TaxID=860376 RepID=A0A9P1ITA4_9PELO|nr:unnamed protein product [Caenorhabditis angaria]
MKTTTGKVLCCCGCSFLCVSVCIMLGVTIVLISSLVLVSRVATFRDQSVAVKGVLICGDEPAGNVRIKLWDEDSGPDPDDLLAQGYSETNGSFFLSGWTTETTPIDPVFKIYHDCNDHGLPTHRKVKFTIPDKYITAGRFPNATMDAGIIQLEFEYMKEERVLMID